MKDAGCGQNVHGFGYVPPKQVVLVCFCREGWERVGGGRTGSDLQWGRINLRSVKNALGQWGVDTETLIRGAVIDSVNNAHLGFTYLLLPHTLP